MPSDPDNKYHNVPLKESKPIGGFRNREEQELLKADSIPLSVGERIFYVVRKVAPFLAPLAVVAFGVLLYVDGLREEDSAVAPEESFPVVAKENGSGKKMNYTVSELQTQNQLREALIEERGGRVALAEFNSVKLVGEITIGGSTQRISILQKSPDLIRVLVEEEGTKTSLGYNGSSYWKTISQEDGSRISADLDGDDRLLLKLLGNLHGPLLSKFLQSEGRVVSVNEVVVVSVNEVVEDSGTVIRVLYSISGKPVTAEVDLDPLNLDLVRWEHQDSDGKVLVVHYSDYQAIGDLSHPQLMEMWVDASEFAVLRIEETTPNFGAVRMLFQSPIAE